MKRYVFILITLFVVNVAKAQIPVTDVGNLGLNTASAVNTANTVTNVIHQIGQIQKTLDFVEKVSSAVRDVRIYKDMITRQNKLNSQCLKTLEDAKKMNLKNMSQISSSIEGVVNNNASIISMTSSILKSDLKMNDSERLEQLEICNKQVREQEAELSKIRSIISYSQTTENNIHNFFKK